MSDDPDGTPRIMQARGRLVDAHLTYGGLKDLGSKLKLPSGWKYRVVTLDEELTISTPQGYSWIVQDDPAKHLRRLQRRRLQLQAVVLANWTARKGCPQRKDQP